MGLGPFVLCLASFSLLLAGAVPVAPGGDKAPTTASETGRSDEVETAKGHVRFDFDQVDILQVIRFVSEATGRNFVVDPKVKGKVTIVSPKEIPLDGVYGFFQSVLEVHGFTTVSAGSLVKIVPISGAGKRAVETQ